MILISAVLPNHLKKGWQVHVWTPSNLTVFLEDHKMLRARVFHRVALLFQSEPTCSIFWFESRQKHASYY